MNNPAALDSTPLIHTCIEEQLLMSWAKIKHVVVLVMENQSFDRMLGWQGLENPSIHLRQDTLASELATDFWTIFNTEWMRLGTFNV